VRRAYHDQHAHAGFQSQRIADIGHHAQVARLPVAQVIAPEMLGRRFIERGAKIAGENELALSRRVVVAVKRQHVVGCAQLRRQCLVRALALRGGRIAPGPGNRFAAGFALSPSSLSAVWSSIAYRRSSPRRAASGAGH
jgi:hypothetical protein